MFKDATPVDLAKHFAEDVFGTFNNTPAVLDIFY
jgi:hypothetical protein